MSTLTGNFFKVSLIAIAIMIAGLIQVQNTAGQAQQSPVLQDNSILKDAKEYATEMNVSEKEALKRLSLQENVGKLETMLISQKSDIFGGLYIQHEPKFQVVVWLTEGNQSRIKRQVREAGIPLDLLHIAKAKFPLEELKKAQNEIQQINVSKNIPIETSVNAYSNLIDVFITEDDYQQHKSSIYIPSDKTNLVLVDGLSQQIADIFGGKHLSDCTAGFSVVKNNGTRGITTAAHCGNTQYFNGVNLPWQYERWDTRYDIQWHTAPGLNIRNLVYDGSSNRYIYSWVSSSHPVGGWVCKYGRTTGYNCGQIKSNTHKPWLCDIRDVTASWVRVHRNGVILGDYGDSGGPVMLGNTAYGSISCKGVFRSNDIIYMPIDRVSILGGGMNVLTYP